MAEQPAYGSLQGAVSLDKERGLALLTQIQPEPYKFYERWEYNSLRPQSALQGLTPLEAAQQGAAA